MNPLLKNKRIDHDKVRAFVRERWSTFETVLASFLVEHPQFDGKIDGSYVDLDYGIEIRLWLKPDCFPNRQIGQVDSAPDRVHGSRMNGKEQQLAADYFGQVLSMPATSDLKPIYSRIESFWVEYHFGPKDPSVFRI